MSNNVLLGMDGQPLPAYPLSLFDKGEMLKLKSQWFLVADIRNHIGMFLAPTEGQLDWPKWSEKELVPLKGAWFYVGAMGLFGLVLAPKGEDTGHVD